MPSLNHKHIKIHCCAPFIDGVEKHRITTHSPIITMRSLSIFNPTFIINTITTTITITTYNVNMIILISYTIFCLIKISVLRHLL